MTTANLLVELFVEELPPKALRKLGEAFAAVLFEQLQAQGLTLAGSTLMSFASPRRLAAHVTEVRERAEDKAVSHKLMPVSVGLDAEGRATPALLKKLQALGADVAAVPSLRRAMDGKVEALFLDAAASGVTLAQGLQKALTEAIVKLPIPKVMTYQLADGWSDVKFVRPAHGLVALHGERVVPVQALGLSAGNTTHGHRFEAAVDPVVLRHADEYAARLAQDGAVIASFEARRAEIVRQLAAAAARVGGGVRAIEDDALLDEVTALVERPNVLICRFDTEFLEVPQECLILTMKANQKYFPLLDTEGKLTNGFLVVSNISPADAGAVIGGNERVVRPRLADAKFFFDQDRRRPLGSRVPGLDRVVYHNKLGSQGRRTQRVRAIAAGIGRQWGGDVLANKAEQAAALAKADLLTDMVGEFPELQGTMGRYYALNDGLGAEVADAIEDHYRPRFAGDALPRNEVGVAVALADKLETLTGLFGIGSLPTGDRDPFALRRHALGVIRMLVERDLPLRLADLLELALAVLHEDLAAQAKGGDAAASQAGESLKALDSGKVAEALSDFIYDRLGGLLREQGFSSKEVDAVVSLRPQRLGEVPQRLAAVREFALLPEAPALAAANKRIANILKKALDVDAHVSELLLREPAERALHAATGPIAARAGAQFDAGDYAGSLQTLAALRGPVDDFFDGVMVNAEEMDLRLNRLGLLATLHAAMNRVADLSKLAS
ncbi:MAG: glycine--tRNA ligase subunit beta [Polaromonas sp.]|uniref:glycine--tRNA ligase subunit beta n=1 Tax=Polaromonas sp. TaxID=1869339 RepID=UPI00273414C0|nr:glycine--tRNA ligase subunit beta [Polaromonas sp.]MDP3249507.1 glycine--tRNA ligase subunit beta [Polaromonas sp.]